MATKLKNMQLTSVDMVRAGANQEADICLFKSAAPQEATESPTAGEMNILKRFLNWFLENPTGAENEPQEDVGKADDDIGYADDPADIYKSAITASLQSIAADKTLTIEEKNSMIEKSIGQYHDAMLELLADPEEDIEKSEPLDMSHLYADINEELEKSDRFDDIEEVE